MSEPSNADIDAATAALATNGDPVRPYQVEAVARAIAEARTDQPLIADIVAMARADAAAEAYARRADEIERLQKFADACRANLIDLRTALALIREAVEQHAPPGSVTAGEHVGPEPAEEAEAIVRGIDAIAAEARAQERERCANKHDEWCAKQKQLAAEWQVEGKAWQAAFNLTEASVHERSAAAIRALPAPEGEHG